MQIINSLISVGQKLPPFSMVGNTDFEAPISESFFDVNNETIKGAWSIFVFYPADFTFICPTELVEFGNNEEKFAKFNAKVYGISTDTEYTHLAWRQNDGFIATLPYPLLSDKSHKFCSNVGALDINSGLANRVTLIVDPDGVVQHVSQTPGDVGRSAKEVLRILSAIQEPGLCPASWEVGDQLIDPDK